MSSNIIDNAHPAQGQYVRATIGSTAAGPIIGRVLSVELSDPAKLGHIRFETLYGGASTNSEAYPITNNFKHYPLKDEIVYIVNGPSYRINDDPTYQDRYYFSPFSLWMNSHHNKHPNKAELQAIIENSQPSLEEVAKGVTTYNETQQPVQDIVESEAISTLRPYPGDVTLEGRWGNAIRFGSTGKSGANKWSGREGEGSPITIITNGFGKKERENWDFLEENINNDASSIWMTTSQEVFIKDINDNFSLESFSAQKNLSQNTLQSIPTLPVSYVKVSAANQDRRNQKK